MPTISAARLASLHTATAAEPTTSSRRDKVLELVFAAGNGQFNKRLQRAIARLVSKQDRPIPALVFGVGRTLFSNKVRDAIEAVINDPQDIEAVVELVLVFPEQLVGTTNDQLSNFFKSLVRLGVSKEVLLLVQDIVLSGGEATRLISTAAVDEDPASLIPGLLGLVGTTWPEIKHDVEALEG